MPCFARLLPSVLLTTLVLSPGCGDDGDSSPDAGSSEGDADTVCEDLERGCGYDPGCNGQIGPDGCICTRERPGPAECRSDTPETRCDVCYSFGSVPWFCAVVGSEAWSWKRADSVDAWGLCTEAERCVARACHGDNGNVVSECDGSRWVPDEEIDCQ